MENTEIKQDSFSIGTNATGGSIKIYFDNIHSQNTIDKIDKAILLWKKCQIATGKAK